jgi:SPP1 gp7 family putative phage head morphogenesis protein
MKKAGFTVEWRTTPEVNDILQASVAENVSLIRSIASHHLTQVEGIVMRSVTEGRDLSALSKDLQEQLGVTRRRAALISRDQNNKITSAIERARQDELGIEEAIWLHSHGGKVPRRTHVAMDGKRYKVRQGMWDADEKKWIWPGQLISCRCRSRSVIPGIG